MELHSADDLRRLVDSEIPEAPSLEYKAALPLRSRSERIEALKDLSGMGNGGGGTIVYGIAEDPEREGVPIRLTPLADLRVAGVLEDIARSGVRPTLLYELRTISLGGDGFALVAEVRRSPLGPYMVESYGEFRHFARHGTRTAPMTEQEVRDAYALAARAREARAVVWEEKALPLKPPSPQPWLTVAAIPEEPRADVFDPADVNLEELRPSNAARIHALHLQCTQIEDATMRMTLWADGVHGDDVLGENRSPRALVRLHRDGSALVADAHPERISLTTMLRGLNAQLSFLAVLWQRFASVRTEVELDLRLENLGLARVDQPNAFHDEAREPSQPIGGPVPRVVLRSVVLPANLCRPHVRHALLLDFAKLLYQAFNFPKPMLLFRWGHLYDQRGPLHLSIGAAVSSTTTATRSVRSTIAVESSTAAGTSLRTLSTAWSSTLPGTRSEPWNSLRAWRCRRISCPQSCTRARCFELPEVTPGLPSRPGTPTNRHRPRAGGPTRVSGVSSPGLSGRNAPKAPPLGCSSCGQEGGCTPGPTRARGIVPDPSSDNAHLQLSDMFSLIGGAV